MFSLPACSELLSSNTGLGRARSPSCHRTCTLPFGSVMESVSLTAFGDLSMIGQKRLSHFPPPGKPTSTKKDPS